MLLCIVNMLWWDRPSLALRRRDGLISFKLAVRWLFTFHESRKPENRSTVAWARDRRDRFSLFISSSLLFFLLLFRILGMGRPAGIRSPNPATTTPSPHRLLLLQQLPRGVFSMWTCVSVYARAPVRPCV